MDVGVYNSTYTNGKIYPAMQFWGMEDNSPYECNGDFKEIRRSNKIVLSVNLSQKKSLL